MENQAVKFCPTCGEEVAVKLAICPACGCILAAVDPEQKQKLQDEYALKKAEESSAASVSERYIPADKIGNFLEEDAVTFWDTLWGEKMPGKFRKIAEKKFTFSIIGAVLPSVWLAFRKKWGASVLVTFINYGLPFALTRITFEMFGANSTGATMGENISSYLSVLLGALFGFLLPRYFWSETQKDLAELGCENRPAKENRALNLKIREKGKPSYVGAALAASGLMLLAAILLEPTLPPIF